MCLLDDFQGPLDSHGHGSWYVCKVVLMSTSYMRLRACNHYALSTLFGGKGGAGPSSRHTMLEGPMKYVNARWM